MKRLKFGKNISEIHIPIVPEIGGESERELNKCWNFCPHGTTEIKFIRRIGKDYDITEIILKK